MLYLRLAAAGILIASLVAVQSVASNAEETPAYPPLEWLSCQTDDECVLVFVCGDGAINNKVFTPIPAIHSLPAELTA